MFLRVKYDTSTPKWSLIFVLSHTKEKNKGFNKKFFQNKSWRYGSKYNVSYEIEDNR